MKKMKKKMIFAVASLLAAGCLVNIYQPNEVSAYPGGIAGYSGSTGNGGANCSSCHSCTPMNSGVTVTSNIPNTGYVPGTTYTITITGNDNTRNYFGFDLSAEDIGGNFNRGTFVITDPGTQLSNGEVTHTNVMMGSGNAISFNVNWTAPAAGSGDVIFNVSLLAVNGNGSTSGDQVHLGSLTVSESATNGVFETTKNNKLEVYPTILQGTNYITVKTEKTNANFYYEVYNINGQLVNQGHLNNNMIEISSQGKYIINILDQDKNLVSINKIIKI